MSQTSLVFSLALLLAPALGAQSKFEFWPGAAYDPAVPTFQKVLGYAPGERVSSHANLLKYLEALAAAAPSRIKVFDYGKTWEGRRLVYAAVGSEANLRRLAEIKAGIQKLSDPRRTPEPEAGKLAASLPAVVWLASAVHGDEISSPEAALLTAYHLLAVRNDKMADEILAGAILLIDPCQNPDGHDRFVHSFEQAEGLEPDPNQISAEHVQPWPGGRFHHYLFDLNRDWFALTQPETRGRVKVLREWYPLVCVDLHEMGSDATYYFAPGARPYNPHLTKEQKDGLELFGKNNARWFDHFGFNYFIREIFDEFYPGYGAAWPHFYGAVAMTYEQASARGLIVRRRDESLMRFRDTVRQHFVACLSTAETAARNRGKLLADFYNYRRSAIEEGSKEPVREYILPRRGDVSAVDKMAALLVEQGVEVKRATQPFRSGEKEYPAGSYVIPLAQPAKRLIRTLLDPQVAMEDSFIQEQERRRRKKLPDEIYDVTAWSLPLLFNVECVAGSETAQGSFELAPASPPAGKVAGANPKVAYLVPWGTAAAGRLLAGAFREGLKILSADKPFTQNGRKFPSGTLIIRVKDNGPNLAETIAKLAASSGAEVTSTDSGWVDEGISFGSNEVVSLRKPSIALAWDYPVSPLSAGWTRFVVERQFGYPVTVVRTRLLPSADLSRFQVLILPQGSYGPVLGEAGVKRLKEWVAAGGTLIGIGGAVAWFADPKVGLLAVSQENRYREEPAKAARPAEPSKPEAEAAKPPAAAEPRAPGKLLATEDEYKQSIQAEKDLPDAAAGILAKARTDPDHWLAAGAAETVNALVEGPAIFTPIKLDKGVNVAVFLGPDQLLASGHLWQETRKQLAYKPLAVAQAEGRGVVIGFIADPNFRAFLDGMNVLFLNAVFRGPAHARPAAIEE